VRLSLITQQSRWAPPGFIRRLLRVRGEGAIGQQQARGVLFPVLAVRFEWDRCLQCSSKNNRVWDFCLSCRVVTGGCGGTGLASVLTHGETKFRSREARPQASHCQAGSLLGDARSEGHGDAVTCREKMLCSEKSGVGEHVSAGQRSSFEACGGDQQQALG
jgi:hypothetical protein